MLTLKKIAVTGAISSGKTQLCSCFREFGAYVVSADEIVHQLLSSNTISGKKVIALLGSGILDNNRISHAAIAEKVFNNPSQLTALEEILHPEVFSRIEIEYRKASKQKAPLFVAEVPLLFETGAEKLFDETIVVIADEQTSIERYTKSGTKDKNEYRLRMSQQLPPKEKAARATYTIFNDGSLQDLQTEAKKIYNQLTA